MPVAPPNNPLLDLMYQGQQPIPGETVTREEMMEIQREQETRLLGTFLVQALFLGLAIMLYATWTWSQFGQPYEAALFYGLMGFSLQASLYYVYRTIFEDSSKHRRQLKRMRTRQKQKMAEMKFSVEKTQLERLMSSQMAQFQAAQSMAVADDYMSQQEANILQQQVNSIAETAQQINPNVDLNTLAKQLGVDRFRVGPIPIGPKLTVTQAPTTYVPIAQPVEQLSNNLDLTPRGAVQIEQAPDRQGLLD